MRKIYPVILAGGNGTRLWPLSRSKYPKQLINFGGERTLFQEAIERNNFSGVSPIILSGQDLNFIILSQLRDIQADILLEPEVKDTLPACLLATLHIDAKDPDALILIAPSDHLIKDVENYQSLVQEAAEVAAQGSIVTFGITADKPHTGYGYIERGEKIKGNLSKVSKFHEKPSLDKAKEYLQDGNYLWNSGIFLFSSKTLINEMEEHNKGFLDLARSLAGSIKKNEEFYSFDKEEFAKLPKISIDYGLLEKSNNIAVCEANINWSDLGSWSAISDISTKDSSGNAIDGDNVKSWNCENLYVKNTSGKLIACHGLKGLSIINTEDALLVIDSKQSEKVKEIVTFLKEDTRAEVDYHNKVHRHWGYYRILNEAKKHKTKELTLLPGKSISLQYHYKRSEHWVVVEGEATVIKGDVEMVLKANESIYIPKTVIHKLSNSGTVDLKVIEVQTGEYLGEDDIVRLSE